MRKRKSFMGRAAGPLLVLLGIAAFPALRTDAAERDYEVISADINGSRTSLNHVDNWSNGQFFAPYTVSSNGSKVVFAKRNGLPGDSVYVPLATGEWCGLNGGCRDIYVRDMLTQTTESALSHLVVEDVHPNSFPTIASAGGRWTVSADANTVVFGWYCYREYDDHPEIIGGTPICVQPELTAPDRYALVLLDLDTDRSEVLSMAGSNLGTTALDISAAGDVVVFDNPSEQPPATCFRSNWECIDTPISVWVRGGGDSTAIAGRFGTITDGGDEVGDFTMEAARVSPDGTKITFLVRARDFEDIFAPDSWRLFSYTISTGKYKEVPLPWQAHPGGNWGLAGSSQNGGVVILSTDTAEGRLVHVDVGTSSAQVFDNIACDHIDAFSLSLDARMVGCWRYNSGLSPAVVDTVTGTITEVATASERFDPYHGGPFVSGDGESFAVLAHRSPEDDPSGFQLYHSSLAGFGTGSGRFVDDDGHTFETDIEWLAAEGVTKGCNPPDNDQFCPNDFVTRGQMAAFLVRALGYADNGGGDLFVDDDGSTFENDIDKLGTAGVTKGCNPPKNDQFCPNDLVTRGQMAAFLVRALGYADNGGGDLFVDDDGSTFENDIDKLGTAGVTKGCNPPKNDQFCPNDLVTRGQMAAFLHRALSA